MAAALAGHRRALWGAAAVSFLVRAGFGLILPALPIYVQAHGIAVSELGLASGAYLGLGIAGMLLLAPLTDRIGHVRGIVGGSVFYVLGTIVLLAAPSTLALLVGRAMQGLAMALVTPATFAYIGTSVPQTERGSAFGTVSAAQMAGFVLGPAAGGVALGIGGSALNLSLAVVAAALTLVVALVLPAEPRAMAADAGGPSAAALGGGLAFWRPLVWLWAAPWGMAYLAYTAGQQVPGGVYNAVWSLFLFHLGAPSWLVGLSYAVWALPLVVLSPILGRRATERRVRLWMVAGGAMMALAACLYALLRNPYAVSLVSMFEGVGAAAVMPMAQIYLAARVPNDRMASAQAVATGLGQVVALLAAVASGFVFPVRSWLPFLLAAAGLAAGTWIFAAKGEKTVSAPGAAAS